MTQSEPLQGNSAKHHCDVVIAGAGPVGLFLACELRLANLSVVVLEKTDGSFSHFKQSPFGLRGLSIPSIEALDRRGLLADLAGDPRSAKASTDRAFNAAPWSSLKSTPGGHFAGIQFFKENIDASKWKFLLKSPGGTNMAVTMQQLETALAVRAEEAGVVIKHSLAVENCEQTDRGVTVHAGGKTFRAKWLVGCDGGRSMVRKTGGFEFAGTDPEFTGYSVQVDLADPDSLVSGRNYTSTGMYTFQKPGTVAMVDFDGGAFHRTRPITLGHVQEVMRRVSCTDVKITALRQATTWTDRAFQATSYRRGRILLAGDAAHVHSPLGGQGLNLGIGDAMNLGWKLAATIHGNAPDGLLDTYEGERLPIGARILDWSRAQVALMRPTKSTRAIEAIVRDLMETRDGATYFADRVWGVSQRYELGNDHPLIGRSVPDFALKDGTRLNDHLRDGKGLLVDFELRDDFGALLESWREQVNYINTDAEDRLGLTTLLVRPDGFVAWASNSNADLGDAAKALSRWFAR